MNQVTEVLELKELMGRLDWKPEHVQVEMRNVNHPIGYMTVRRWISGAVTPHESARLAIRRVLDKHTATTSPK